MICWFPARAYGSPDGCAAEQETDGGAAAGDGAVGPPPQMVSHSLICLTYALLRSLAETRVAM